METLQVGKSFIPERAEAYSRGSGTGYDVIRHGGPEPPAFCFGGDLRWRKARRGGADRCSRRADYAGPDRCLQT